MVKDVEAITYVNGKRYQLPDGKAEYTLLQWLREIGLTGTKLGCGEGGCGACTVMISYVDNDGKVVHRSANACLFPLYAAESCHVVTVEGIGNKRQGLHPVQKQLAESHGSQCGFCTPGFVMSMYALLRNKGESKPSALEIEEALAGNLCRCTGYRPILEAFRTFSKGNEEVYYTANGNGNGNVANGNGNGNGHSVNGNGNGNGNGCPMGANCCKVNGNGQAKKDAVNGNGKGCEQQPPSEPIFPIELKKKAIASLTIPGPKATWYRPTSVQELLALKHKYPDARLVCGNSEVGIEMKFKNAGYKVLISPMRIKELSSISVSDTQISIGASVTLTSLMEYFHDVIDDKAAFQVQALEAIVKQLKWFAGNQIKNVATVAGNIVTGSPISDLNPLWIACKASFVLLNKDAVERTVPADKFFLGYRKVDMFPDEILARVTMPLTEKFEYVKEFKQAHRREDDISIVCAGMRVKFACEGGKWLVEEIGLSYGGVAAKTISAGKTEKLLIGKEWNRETLQLAIQSLREEICIAPNAPGGMVEFRRSLITSFFFKFFVKASFQLATDAPDYVHSISATEKSVADEFDRPASSGLQYYNFETKEKIVGRPLKHASADLQVTGEAKYVDDVVLPREALHAALVTSSRPHALIKNINAECALKMDGVCGFFCSKDVPGGNDIGPVIPDEECFASERVTAVGQIIGLVVATTEAQARDAARMVQVDYEDLPAIMTIEEAIEQESFFSDRFDSVIERGDVDSCFGNTEECTHIVEGDFQMGGQDHFYLETNACVVIPTENDEFLTYSSTQAPTKHQKMIAHVLGISMNKVVCKTKRLGGGFGGKETRSIFLNVVAAVPAYHLKKPIRLCLDRDEDMQMTGHRHAFLGKYKVGFTKEGKILAVDLKIYNNGGNSLDLSAAVMQRAVLHSDNCYDIPHVRWHGKVCKTNTSSNTAFRGFGGPQGMTVAEAWIDHVARELKTDVEVIREINLYHEGDKIPCGMVLEGNSIQRIWKELMVSSKYAERKELVKEFNAMNKHKKRGICVMPSKFGIAFTLLFMNQGGALVHIYTDGTVLITHGGVEMGQGLHTKIAQIAADELKVPLSDVFISETSTDKVPNSSPTAASASSDLYGAAVLDACQQLNKRLQKYRKELPEGTNMAKLAITAHMDRVDLSAHGFHATPDITGFGGDRPFAYFTYGAACSEVEVDLLTGDFQVLQTDILMDVGNSINPALDVGQIEGAFTQGMGLFTIEELIWGDNKHPWVRPGMLYTRGPGTYKIPTANDIPIKFNVSLLEDAPNPHAVASSKAIGEPPLFLASSIFFAIKNALYDARAAAGEDKYFLLNAPATPEKIRMSVVDDYTSAGVDWNFQAKASI